MELQPDTSVSLLDTDLAADVTPSADFMAKIAAEQEKARAESEAAAALEAAEAKCHAEAAAVRFVERFATCSRSLFAYEAVVAACQGGGGGSAAGCCRGSRGACFLASTPWLYFELPIARLPSSQYDAS